VCITSNQCRRRFCVRKADAKPRGPPRSLRPHNRKGGKRIDFQPVIRARIAINQGHFPGICRKGEAYLNAINSELNRIPNGRVDNFRKKVDVSCHIERRVLKLHVDFCIAQTSG